MSFLVICPDTDLKGGMHIAETTRQKVSELQVDTGEQAWLGSLSVGVAEMTQEFETMNELIKVADEVRLFSEKSGQKPRFVRFRFRTCLFQVESIVRVKFKI